MAEKEKNTYGEIHEQLTEAMQQVYLNDMLEDVKEPNIDLSFLSENKKSKKKYNNLIRIGTVAVVVIVVLLGANIVLLSSENVDSYGDKGILHRLYVSISEMFTDKNDEYADDIEGSIEITKEGDFNRAKQYLPQLYLPEYIPDGYELDKLYIEKYNSGDAISTFNYLNTDGDTLEISCIYCKIDKFDYEYQGTGEAIKLKDRTLYLEWDDIQEEYYLTVYTEICTINIYAENCDDKSVILMIGENMSN